MPLLDTFYSSARAYGLKQSAYLWNARMKEILKSIGFRPVQADAGVFINKEGIIIALYDDDLMILGKKLDQIERVKSLLAEAHPMKDMGEAKKVLGIHIHRHPDGSISLDQRFYIEWFLSEFNMETAKEAEYFIP